MGSCLTFPSRMILGDFNFEYDDEDVTLQKEGYHDIWVAVHGPNTGRKGGLWVKGILVA